MDIKFSDEEIKKVYEIKRRYPEPTAALMPILWMAQKKFGWLSAEVQSYIAEALNFELSLVNGVASFYTMYFKKPPGKYHIQVCTNVSCMLRGGEKIYNVICDKLGIKNLETTADGLFSIEEVECMGACGGAPMIAINEDYYENADKRDIDGLLNQLK